MQSINRPRLQDSVHEFRACDAFGGAESVEHIHDFARARAPQLDVGVVVRSHQGVPMNNNDEWASRKVRFWLLRLIARAMNGMLPEDD